MEFIQERTFYPRLALVQLAAGDQCAMVDPLAVSDLGPLEAALSERTLVKVLHAGSQDLKIFFDRTGVVPASIFDTQIAAAMAGVGDQIGFGPLVEHVTGTRLAKAESFTDWLQRPLTEQQERYALDDVRYLFALHDALSGTLDSLGRSRYANEEFARFEQRSFYVADPRELYRKVKRFSHLDSRGQAVLRELAAWRHEEAQRRNKPRGWIVADELLIEIARRAPADLDALGRIRSMKPQTVKESGDALLTHVRCGREVPKEKWPQEERRQRLAPAASLAADLLNLAMKSACHEASISPSMVGTTADVQELVRCHLESAGQAGDSPLTRGWRGELVGTRLRAMLDGSLSVGIDPQTLEPVFGATQALPTTGR